MIIFYLRLFLFTILLFQFDFTYAQYVQQGDKLVGNNSGIQYQGETVSISSDGKTLVAGAKYDDNGNGTAWVFSRTGNTWSQEAKLTGTGQNGTPNLGFGVAISGDGLTIIAGGTGGSLGFGAFWIFVKTNTGWVQQGSKLRVLDFIGDGLSLGYSVDLSYDGSTAVIGGPTDNNSIGAVWVFTRTNGTWSKQAKLVGSGSVGNSRQGHSVSISNDGNTVTFSGRADNSNTGAVWVFERSGSNWTQVGNKIVGPGIGTTVQGQVSISGDGQTLIIGGIGDNGSKGAAWVYTKSNGNWIQQGSKLTASGLQASSAALGRYVALSENGDVAAVGASNETDHGAIVLFKRTGISWSQYGSKLVGTGVVGSFSSQQGFSVAISDDGHTLISGGFYDNNQTGAVWVFVEAPTITDFTPQDGTFGTEVIINGSNFTGASNVLFGGVPASSFTVNSTQISAIVGLGSSGDVKVITSGGEAVLSGFNYTITSGTSTKLNIQNIKIFPNPMQEILTIKLTEKFAIVKIYDQNGRQVFYDVVESAEYIVNLSCLDAGQYTLDIESKADKINYRLIKE